MTPYLREMRNTADYRPGSAVINPTLVATQLGRLNQVIAAISVAQQNPTTIRQVVRNARDVLGRIVQGND